VTPRDLSEKLQTRWDPGGFELEACGLRRCTLFICRGGVGFLSAWEVHVTWPQ
jgi:hypothetical protein